MAHALNRRTAIGAITTAGALLAVPAIVNAAAHADAELLALAKRVKDISARSDALDDALAALEESFQQPEPPECLLFREGDEAFAGVHDSAVANLVGKPFPDAQLKVLRSLRHFFQTLYTREGDGSVKEYSDRALLRVTEVDIAAGQYLADLEAAREAHGLSEAERACEESHQALQRAFRELAFTPAVTKDGVLAKLGAVASWYFPRKPEDYPDSCPSDVVTEMAIVELASIQTATES